MLLPFPSPPPAGDPEVVKQEVRSRVLAQMGLEEELRRRFQASFFGVSRNMLRETKVRKYREW